MSKKVTRLLACALAAMAVFALAGCGQTGASGTSGESSEATTEATTTATTTQVPVITADDVLALDDDVYLVDTRTPEEYAGGHIPGALNASYPKSSGGPCESADNAAAFRSAWSELNIPVDAKVVVYCRTGVRASAAASALLEDGYSDVKIYEGSWTDWTSDASRPVETA